MGSMYVSVSALNDSSIFIDNPTPSTTSLTAKIKLLTFFIDNTEIHGQ